MKWLLPLLGLGVAGVGAATAYLLRARNALVVYANDPQDPDRGTFANAASVAAGYLRTRAVPVRSAVELVDAIQRAPSNLGVVVLVGHGSSTKFLSPARFGISTSGTRLPAWISPVDFARVLAPKLARGAVVSLAGCSAARSPSEPSGWVMETGWHGGADSLAGRIRDALARAGASGEVRAHVVTGTTLDNPQGRTFFIRREQTGRPGVHISALAGRSAPRTFDDYVSWNNHAQGPIARSWMLGRDIMHAA